MIAELAFQPGLILDSSAGDAARNFPISLKTLGPGADKRDVYALRYRSFHAAGWIGPQTLEQFHDSFDELGSSLSIAAYQGETVVGTIRLTFGGEGLGTSTMPSQANFPAEIARLQALGNRRLVEFTRLAVEPGIGNTSFRTTLYGTLVRAGTVVALAGEVDYAVIAVHEKLARVYRFLAGFEELARSASYGDIAEPTHLLGRDFQALNSRRRLRNAFFRITPQDVATARVALARVAPLIAGDRRTVPERKSSANGEGAPIRRDKFTS